MILELTIGCICDSLTVDGAEEMNLFNAQREECLREIGQFIAKISWEDAKRIADEILSDYETEEDLSWGIDSFYQLLLDKEIIKPLEQLKDMSDSQKSYVIKLIRAELSMFIRDMDPSYLNELLQGVIPFFGEYESLGHCECCGDYIDRYTLII